MIFRAENSGPFKTRANGSWTIYVQGPVVSMTSRNTEVNDEKRWKLCFVILYYSDRLPALWLLLPLIIRLTTSI